MRIDRLALMRLFDKLDEHCTAEQVLCIIGAAAILAHGHDGRQTQDVDVWRPASVINDRALRRAAEAAGIGYNPMAIEADAIYLQVITPGIVNLPTYDDGRWSNGQPSETLWQGDKIRIVVPPPSIIVAAKLIRAEDRDIDDCVYLVEAKRIDLDQIRQAVLGIPNEHDRRTAEENIALLAVLNPATDAIGTFSPEDGGEPL